jgi:hypothetical protein
MGFNISADTITLNAKLTPVGRARLVSTNNNLVTTFSLGDSDANYNVTNELYSGQIPAQSGNIGIDGLPSNSTGLNFKSKSTLIVNTSGTLRKPVEIQSSNITTDNIPNGLYTASVSDNSLTQNVINRNNYLTDSLVNLYYSFGLPLNSTDDTNYTGVTYANGGFSDTALSGLAQNNILVLGISNDVYGESLDGKTIQVFISTSASTYTIYSTFQNKNVSKSVEDINIKETSVTTNNINPNIAFLFSDDIQTPNGNPNLSWSTGYNTLKPFSLNNKQFFNLTTNSNLGLNADTVVGIAYLDKGIIVITHPTIVNAYIPANDSMTYVSYNSVSTSVQQNITCIAGRGEFGASTNPTFKTYDTPRISEILLYDNIGNIIAVAKSDRHILKKINDFKVFNIKITI